MTSPVDVHTLNEAVYGSGRPGDSLMESWGLEQLLASSHMLS